MKIKQAKLSGAGVYLGALVTVTTVAASALVIPNVAADNSSVDQVQINVLSSCTLTGTGGAYSVELANGTKNENIGSTDITAFCNDSKGFGIYAVGASDDDEGDTYMHHDSNSAYDFNTGTTFSGATSAWAMKLAATAGTYAPHISTGFDSFHDVPTQYTMVAYRDATDGGTDKEDDTDAEGATIITTYGVYVSGTQAPGTYTGKVRYALIHPYTNTNLISLEKALTDASAPTKTVGGKTYFTMQGMTSNICATANIIGEGSQLKMVDNRDDKIYYVTKLADGHCWMTQNLDHDIVAQENYYTPANTDISANWTPISTAATMSAADMSTGWTDSTTSPQSADTGDWYWNNTWYDSGECIDLRYGSDICIYLNGDQVGKFSQSSSAFSSGTHGHVGNYYNWTAAIAMNDSTGITTGDASSSICPAGWRLPTGGSGGEFAALNAQYGNSTSTDANIITSPLYFVRGGRVNAGFLFSPGFYGSYWFSTVYSSDSAYHLHFNSSRVDSTNLSRNFALSVRCIAR